MEEIIYTPIGVIHSPFADITGMPIQPAGAQGVLGTVDIEPEYCDGLKDLEGFSHIILVYHFHLAKGYSLQVKPFLDDSVHGVFATRAPKRPNPLGISVVKLQKVETCTLHIEDVDVIDGTPLLDIKPYVPEFDVRTVEQTGWLTKRAHNAYKARADNRFR
ncbi:MAG: tRNA (N6-threonylcarbamoyladenosine(37)-N6)-methyltransferase TrmO [Theionarchaea archaeon]|nr:MAG: tRNA-Thr(GGU) m(6)t(6)A37 methyltransferase TsaA [Theionarchaea archaeon DG-70-1]MBU7026616.1 tRNA (N6-threonylcarbamoyladenosine(37)-N6)-methyltransferase TrmO [Theionarchaea archaeon]